MIDVKGVQRKTGEEWLIKEPGLYLPGVYEELVGVSDSYIITPVNALHLRASREFKDAY